MVLDFMTALFYIVIIWSLGQWTARRLFENIAVKNTYLLSFVLGFSELTLLSTFLYFTCRMPTEAIRVVWLLLGCAAVIDTVRRREIYKPALTVLGGVIGLWLLMLLPGMIGRDQYYVYRGNCTDQQTYVEETVALSMHPIGWYESQTKEEIELVSDVLWRGYHWAVTDRPSAGMMIAVLRCNSSGEIYWIVYLYRMFVLAMSMPSLLYLFGVILKEEKWKISLQKMIWIMGAVLYCIGFWGQIQYDIDAVSQISAIAVMTALTAEFLCYAQGLVEGEEWNKRQYFAIILLASAGLALYLESALVHAVLYLAAGIQLLLRRKKKLVWRQIVQLIGIPTTALGILILANYRIMLFLMAQINTSVSDERQSWSKYFNTWWLGRHGIDDGRITGPISRVVNCIVSTSGMYNMTVNYERHSEMTANILTGVMVLVSLLIIICIFRLFFTNMGQSIWMLWIVILTSIVIIIGMCVGGKYWSAGKLLYYVSPYLYTFLLIPALQIRDCRGFIEKLALGLAILLIMSNVKMVLQKCNDVRVNWACVGYRGTYPSDMIPGLKTMAYFTFDTRQLEDVDSVIISDLSMVSDYQFYLQYLKVKLTCAEISWIAEKDINYYQEELEISQKRTLRGNLVTLEAVQNGDGRYEIEIR